MRHISIPMCGQSTSCNAMAHTDEVEHHKEGASGYTRSYTAYTVLPQIDDEKCRIKHTPVRKPAPLTAWSSSLRCVLAADHHNEKQYSKTGKGKTPKASPKKRSVMEYSPGLSQDTKSLRTCSVIRAKTLLKGHLGIKSHSKYIKVIRLLEHIAANS